MAKKHFSSVKNHDVSKKITTKSAYGSHADMVVDHSQFNLLPQLTADQVVCKDGDLYYITYRNRLDSGVADALRYNGLKYRLCDLMTEPQNP